MASTVILEHRAGEDGPAFWTLYGHLSRETLAMGRKPEIAQGQQIGAIGSHQGEWRLGPAFAFPDHHREAGPERRISALASPRCGSCGAISPDPNLILRLAPESFTEDKTPPEVPLKRRAEVWGPLSISYRKS